MEVLWLRGVGLRTTLAGSPLSVGRARNWADSVLAALIAERISTGDLPWGSSVSSCVSFPMSATPREWLDAEVVGLWRWRGRGATVGGGGGGISR